MRILWPSSLRQVESVDNYLGVLVPLEEAHNYSHSKKQSSEDDDAASAKDGDSERLGMLSMDLDEYSIEGLRREMRRGGNGQWTEYEIKSKLINKAIQDIGMGTYNWQLFVLCGFGWFADNLWLQGISLTLPSLSGEFDISEKTVRYTTSALYVGLSLGSVLWGIGSDFFGRRIAFNLTLLITGVFGLISAYATSWGGVCFFFGALGFGVGGNLPVDGALFLEFLPDASSSLLTLLSIWWPVGQLASSIVAWYFMGQWPVNQGWRMFVVTLGFITLIMFGIRCFAFHLFESPKFLLNTGRQNEAVAVIHGIAYRNHTKTWLTAEILDQVSANEGEERPPRVQVHATSRASSIIKDKLKNFSVDRLRPLFKTKTLALATTLIWFCWASVGIGFPLFTAFLPQYFAHHGDSSSGSSMQSETSEISDSTYRNYAITSAVGVPGSFLAAYLVDHPSPFLGRRGTLASSTLVSAIFLFLFVQFGQDATAQLVFSCVVAFSSNVSYAVLYTITPEMFPAPVRGAGSGVASFLNRMTGLMAPVLAATVPGDGATVPVYCSAVLILGAFVAMCLIPIETRGAQKL
ncbi:major facilitator superfamily domain-containing protein [Stachybotrys elegans]|uniref:Major facilitator superfamily domain-containing protein n=1 Tax=Stachybotrys elegans TaxID=80388 RepID=A0A8K0WUY5_9HYPO|nr:major facilitator superfamily domain-containing protein [Stachybotrys elegans]